MYKQNDIFLEDNNYKYRIHKWNEELLIEDVHTHQVQVVVYDAMTEEQKRILKELENMVAVALLNGELGG